MAGTCGGGTLGCIAYLVLVFFAVMRRGLHFDLVWETIAAVAALVIFTVAGGIAGAYYGWKHFEDQGGNTADGTQPPGRRDTEQNL